MNLQMFSAEKMTTVCLRDARSTYRNSFSKCNSGAASLLLHGARDWALAVAALKLSLVLVTSKATSPDSALLTKSTLILPVLHQATIWKFWTDCFILKRGEILL